MTADRNALTTLGPISLFSACVSLGVLMLSARAGSAAEPEEQPQIRMCKRDAANLVEAISRSLREAPSSFTQRHGDHAARVAQLEQACVAGPGATKLKPLPGYRDVLVAYGRARDALSDLKQRGDAFDATRRQPGRTQPTAGAESSDVARLRANVVAPQPVPPRAGVEAISPMKPTWCDGVLAAKGNGSAHWRFEWRSNITDGIVFSCRDPDWDIRQKVVAAYRQQMSNDLGVSAAVNERLMKLGGRLVVLDAAKRRELDDEVCAGLPPLAAGSASTRAIRALERVALGCGTSLNDDNRMNLRDVDRPEGLSSQLATAAVVDRVLPALGEGRPDWLLTQASTAAVLHASLTWDPSAFERQLAALKLNDVGQARALMTYYGAKAKLEQYIAGLKALAPKVPGLERLVFEAPRAAVKAYAARAEQEKPVLALVLALEAQKSAGLKGCAQKLWPHVETPLKAQAQDKIADLKIPGALAYALALCGRRDSEVPGLESIFEYYTYRSLGWRGPMSAAYRGVLDGYNEGSATSDNRGFDPTRREPVDAGLRLPLPAKSPVDELDLPPSLFGHLNTLNPAEDLSGGIVAALENKGATTKITFRWEKEENPIIVCTDTNKIDRIAPDGHVVYRQNCSVVGTRPTQSQPVPVVVPTWALCGVKPGAFVIPLRTPSNSDVAGRGWVLEARESKANPRRTCLLGVRL